MNTDGIEQIRERADALVALAAKFPSRHTKAELLRAAAILYRHVAIALDTTVATLLDQGE